jgi:hypothetical protein
MVERVLLPLLSIGVNGILLFCFNTYILKLRCQSYLRGILYLRASSYKSVVFLMVILDSGYCFTLSSHSISGQQFCYVLHQIFVLFNVF